MPKTRIQPKQEDDSSSCLSASSAAMSASQQNRGKETIGRWYRRYFGIGGRRQAEQGSGGVGANSSSFDDKHCFVVDQRFVAVLSKMVILLHRAIQKCIADFPSRASVVLAQKPFKSLAHLLVLPALTSFGLEEKNVPRILSGI